MMSEHIKNASEKQFAEILERRGSTYIYQPKDSRLSGINYTPDFYIWTIDTFYEIIGSRQAFNQNRAKVLAAKDIVCLKIIKPDGADYDYQDIRKENSLTRIPVMDEKKRAEHKKILNGTKWSNFLWIDFMDKNNLDIHLVSRILDVSYPCAYSAIKNSRIRKSHMRNLVMRGFRNLNQFIQLS